MENKIDDSYIEPDNPGNAFESQDKVSRNVLDDPEFVPAEIRPKKERNSSSSVTFFQLFRFATKFELCFLILGVFFGTIGALGLPFSFILYGEFSSMLVDRALPHRTSSRTTVLSWFGGGKILTNATEQEIHDALLEDSKGFGIGTFCGAIVQLMFISASIDLLNFTALRQIKRIRVLFLKSVLRQDMLWYDTNTSDNFAVKITENLDKLKEGISEKLVIFIYLLMTFVFSVVVSLFYGWKLSLVILSCVPIIIFSTVYVTKMQGSLTEKELKSYSGAGSVAEEVLSSIRTVTAFGGEEKEQVRYKNNLKPAVYNGKRKGLFSGIGGGIMWFIIFCIYALAFWYGIQLILEDRDKIDKEYTPAILIIVLFGVTMGAQTLGMTSPHLEAFSTAKASAFSIFNVIDRKPDIDSSSADGKKLENIEGSIKFFDVKFHYPARPDVQILNGLNLELKSGQTTALVGRSGCGKSTCLQLIQRLYDPLNGSVEIDGVKITELNIQWLRSKIGVVGQEPVLFAETIRENIRYGNPECSDEDIEKAARIANCHSFIMKLPNGYDTLIGERGAQLSGGQKQRVAIARAIVRNPTILILDEATSALDPTSEKRVQNALEKASKGRTTIVVSHRLSTIFNADKIVLLKEGIVVEEGTHAELMKQQGMYYELVNANNTSKDSEAESPRHHRRKISKLKRVESLTSESESEDEIDEDSQISLEEDEDDKVKVSSYRLLKMNSPEWHYILFGCFGAVLFGAAFPAFAVLFGEIFGIISMDDVGEIQDRANLYSLLFLGLALMTGLGTFIQIYMFTIAGVQLTSRLRYLTFRQMISQEMAWFDDTKNAVGSLCARLSSDCSSIQGATGSRIGSILQSSSVVVFGIGVSMYFSWKLTLIASISMPLVLFFIIFEARYMESSTLKEKEAMEDATKLAVEAISNIRTVASLGQETHVLSRYEAEIEKADVFCQKKSRLRGVVFGLGQTVPIFCYGFSFWYGGTLVAEKEIPYENVIKVGEALIFGSWMLGQSLAYAPNVSAALISASRILRLLDRVPKIQNPKPMPFNTNNKFEGNIMYKNVEFRYPTRPTIPILNGLNLKIINGKTVALVGASGCGKSTCMQLLLRYYDPDEGQVEVDGTPTVDFPLDRIRSRLGLVSQEPILFDRTIAENIAYGDNSREVPMNEIIEAARAANIHEFVINLPLQYDTSLGSKGAQLSGGQKQRIAIARALVRNPKILLLDEATSALDTHSEKVVQAALDKARTGRTCIVIAHRLTTIQNADLICVIENGQVVEKGAHNELMRKGEKYAKLYKMQQVE